MNHIIFINLNFISSATTISKRNICNLKSIESIAFSSKWVINRQSVFKKTMIKFKIDIENFWQRYFQSRIKTFFSANNISLNKKFSSFTFKFASRFLENVYCKFIRDQNQSRFTSTNSLNLSSISEIKEKQFNILKIINFFSIFFADSIQDRSWFESLIFSLIEILIEEIIYDHFIDL